MEPLDVDVSDGEKSKLLEQALAQEPRFASSQDARAFFSAELERLADSGGLSIDELVGKAYASPQNDDVTVSVLSLVRKLSCLKRA